MRVGVYADLLYRRDADGLSTDRAFVNFVTNLAGGLEELVIFGRLVPESARSPYRVEAPNLRFVSLPHYPSVKAVWRLVGSFRGARRIFEQNVRGLDAVWVFGPHPVASILARVARRRGVPVFLGVRQDFPAYVANRLPGPAWAWARPTARLLEWAFRRTARRAPAIVVGDELAKAYAGGAPVLGTGFSLIRAADVVSVEEALGRDWGAELSMLAVGRLDPEKNPLLLPEILAGLVARFGGYRLVVAGEGPLMEAVASRARELGVEGRLDLRGYIPNGPQLWELYRRSHAFLHVSYTEGLPQVLYEAQSLGLPIVATDVGGVSAALGGGVSGLLVPPADAQAAVEAIERLRNDQALRKRLVLAGLEQASRETLEAQGERVLAFLRASLSSRAR